MLSPFKLAVALGVSCETFKACIGAAQAEASPGGETEEGQGQEVTPLQPGDRVRVVVADHESGYGRGDRGTVHRVDATSRGPLYHVAMDKAGGTDTTVIFAASEIEPDP